MGSLEQGDISTFEALFPENVLLSSSKSYHNLATKHWVGNVILSPSCVFVPKTAEQAAEGFRYIVKHSIPFNVRGGGHNTNRGWGSIDATASEKGGVLISTAGLGNVELEDKDGEVLLRVGTGVSLVEIYEFLHDEGITIAAGSSPTCKIFESQLTRSRQSSSTRYRRSAAGRWCRPLLEPCWLLGQQRGQLRDYPRYR